MRSRRPRRRAREIPALLFAAIWLLGFEVAPALHLVRHAALPRHTHAEASHCHGDTCHDDAPASEASDGADSPDHGDGSIEHRGVAALHPAPIVLPIGGAPIAELVPLVALRERVDLEARARPSARAPPASRV